MTEEENQNSILQKKLFAILSPEHDLIQFTSNVKIFTSKEDGKDWLYSDLDGLLCFILDYKFPYHSFPIRR